MTFPKMLWFKFFPWLFQPVDRSRHRRVSCCLRSPARETDSSLLFYIFIICNHKGTFELSEPLKQEVDPAPSLQSDGRNWNLAETLTNFITLTLLFSRKQFGPRTFLRIICPQTPQINHRDLKIALFQSSRPQSRFISTVSALLIIFWKQQSRRSQHTNTHTHTHNTLSDGVFITFSRDAYLLRRERPRLPRSGSRTSVCPGPLERHLKIWIWGLDQLEFDWSLFLNVDVDGVLVEPPPSWPLETGNMRLAD